MQTRESYFSIKPFFWHALASTLAIIVVPLLLVLGLVAFAPQIPLLPVAIVGIGLAIAATAVGAMWWNKRVESTEIGFSDLMLWRWFVRRRAEDTLEAGARLLGLDRSGHPIEDVRITPEQQLQVLKDLTAALESKDPYTHGHSQRVERHVYRTAAAMHLPIQDIEDLRKAAALHDVGKIRVPDRILRKPEDLSSEERAVIEEHAVVGAWMVSSVGNADVIAAVRHHHERWDGAGYPDGLAGHDIPLYARIIAVTDAYDAITSARPYRSSSGRDDAVDALRAGEASQFDPEIVEAFIAALPARLPVTAGLFLVIGGAPQRLLRAFAAWLKRLGAGSLSPAVGAAGAAVVLGASIFTPSIPARPTHPGVAAPAESSEFDVDALPRTVRNAREKQQVTERESTKRRIPTEVLAGSIRREEGEFRGEPLDGNGPHPEEPKAEEDVPEPKASPAEEKTKKKSNPNDDRDSCSDDGNAGGGNDPARCGASNSHGKGKAEGKKVLRGILDRAQDKAKGKAKDDPKGKAKGKSKKKPR